MWGRETDVQKYVTMICFMSLLLMGVLAALPGCQALDRGGSLPMNRSAGLYGTALFWAVLALIIIILLFVLIIGIYVVDRRRKKRVAAVMVLPYDGGVVTSNSAVVPHTAENISTYRFKFGQTATFTAHPKAGRVFEGWYLNGKYEGNSAVINITMTQNWRLTAVFSSSNISK